MPTITITAPINVSVQPNDTLYASVVVNNQSGKNHPSASAADTKPVAIGKITDINRAQNKISYTTTNNGNSYSSPPGSFVYLFASKDNRANTSGIVGYFAECEFRNYSSKAAEIFVTGVEYVPSSK
tara:strand:+ start:2200 stop:2577 length:378 start_codon:yes stop_codon:yes gene_type:complete